MKKHFSLLLCLLLCLSFLSLPAFALVEASDSYYVTDAANVLSADTEEMICQYNAALENQCDNAQIVIVSVEYLDGMYSDEYATQLFNDWGVGGSSNNGMLLLFATEENKGWLATGAGLGMSDNEANDLLDDYFWPEFDRKNYDEAVQNLFPQLLRWYDDRYGSAVYSSDSVSSDEPVGSGGYIPITPQNKGFGLGAFLSRAVGKVFKWILILVVVLVVIGLFSRPTRRRHYSNYRAGAIYPLFFFTNRRHHRPPPGPGMGTRPRSNPNAGFGSRPSGGRSTSSRRGSGFGGRSSGGGGGRGGFSGGRGSGFGGRSSGGGGGRR